MPKVMVWAILLLGLICLMASPSVYLAKGQPPVSSSININADGSVEPSTAPIEYKGNVYTLTSNISGGIVVHRSNIFIDGAGYALNGASQSSIGIDLRNNVTGVPSPQEIFNVTVKNLAIINFDRSVDTTGGGNDTFYNDYIANTLSGLRGGVFFWICGGNNITHCTINGEPAVYMHFGASSNSIVENNLSGGFSIEISGNEHIDRNYYADYLTRYPNATEIGNSGTWNTPYQSEEYGSQTRNNTIVPIASGSIQDNHPQKNPYSMQSYTVPEFSPSAILIIASLTLVLAILLKRRNTTQPLSKRY
jgi:hypothetical protein